MATFDADICAHLRAGLVYFSPTGSDYQYQDGVTVEAGLGLGLTAWAGRHLGFMLRGELNFPLRSTGFRLGDSTLFQPNVAQFSLLGGIRVRIPRKTAAR